MKGDKRQNKIKINAAALSCLSKGAEYFVIDSGNHARREFLRRELESWQIRYFRDVYPLFEKGDGQLFFIALKRWEDGFRSFLLDRFPGLVESYDALTAPSMPQTQAPDSILTFNLYKSNQIEAFLSKCIEDAGTRSLDQNYLAPGSIEITRPFDPEEIPAIRVFISYSHHDKTFARKLAGVLEGRGMKVWWDYDSLKGGQDWQKELELGIKQCDFFLVILTPEAVDSEWVGNEITYATLAQKTVIPLCLKNCDIPIGLIKKHYIDFERQTQKSAIEELLSILKQPNSVD